MPLVKIISENKIIEENVTENTNLVVQAGIKKFPYPYLKYKCGMGTCGTCSSLIINGQKYLPDPTWKEVKILKEKFEHADEFIISSPFFFSFHPWTLRELK